ncbi:hypothetical protein F5X96DRAFT_629862 [Biscogniauxia mediterranea]|nr:hypothetical protein F5X96DRAFT_629862 [Biscogniauxia mediterranea]
MTLLSFLSCFATFGWLTARWHHSLWCLLPERVTGFCRRPAPGRLAVFRGVSSPRCSAPPFPGALPSWSILLY